MQVQEIMTRNPACCTPDSALPEVARMMERNDCGCIPVVESPSSMRPVGTITDRDIAIRSVAAGHDASRMRASDVMTTDVATVRLHSSIEECFEAMEDREIRRVLVVDEQGKCCGIVAQADIVQSGANPLRTNQVIREISESQESPQGGFSAIARPHRGRMAKRSFFDRDSLAPLAVGLGAGAALALLLGNLENRSRVDFRPRPSNFEGSEEGLLDIANSEPIGIYPDAEDEIERRRQHLEERVETARSELESPSSGREASIENEETGDVGRGAA